MGPRGLRLKASPTVVSSRCGAMLRLPTSSAPFGAAVTEQGPGDAHHIIEIWLRPRQCDSADARVFILTWQDGIVVRVFQNARL